MNIQDMFLKDINREINGVIKVMQTDDENRRQELEEYVITRELQRHFTSFFDRYEQSISSATDKMGVWISGFFGSGKSHFLKILSYLLANQEVDGIKPLDVFREKFAYDPLTFARIERCVSVPTEVIIFNIDAKSPMGKDDDAILRVFTKVFNEHCGYYGDDLKVAHLERHLDERGQLSAFHTHFERVNGEPWEQVRQGYAFFEDDVVAALTQATGMSESAAKNWFNSDMTAEISIESFARDIQAYVKDKPRDFRLLFLVDEIGQYIGDHSGLMLNLQTVVEELGTKCRGKVWVMVTSQEAIDSVVKVKGDDFSKIQGRFNTRLSLSSASSDEVINSRLLEKHPDAQPLLRLLYSENEPALRNLFTFSQGTVADLKGYSSQEEFLTVYPFVSYQYILLQQVLMEIRKHGSSGKSLSGGERSMLSAFQEAAQAVNLREEGTLVPFHSFYDSVHTFLDSTVRRVIDRAQRAQDNQDGLLPGDVDVLKLLFLVRYVEGLPADVENLSTLMVDHIQADKIILRQRIQASLERLIAQNYVARNGDRYQFLTDDEQDINREIRNTVIDQGEVIRGIGRLIFADIYPAPKYRYRGRADFSYNQMVDDSMLGQGNSEISLRFVTLAYEQSGPEAEKGLLMRSQNDEAIVLLSQEYDYFGELEERLRIDKYVRQRNLSQLPEPIQRIIRIRQEEGNQREKRATQMLRDAITAGRFFAAGERLALGYAPLREKLDQLLSHLVKNVYHKFDLVEKPLESEAGLQAILLEPVSRETLMGAEVRNQAAMDDLLQYMETQQLRNLPVTVLGLHKRYQATPYGWPLLDIAAQIASLLVGQRLQLSYGGAPLFPSDPQRLINCLLKRREAESTIVKIRPHVGAQLLEKARLLAREMWTAGSFQQEEIALCEQVEAALRDELQAVKSLLVYHESGHYPQKKVLENGRDLLQGILDQRGDNQAFLIAFTNKEHPLKDYLEDTGEITFFFQNQREIFNEALALVEKAEKEMDYFASEKEALEALTDMRQILDMEKPYRLIRNLPTLSQTIKAAYQRITQEKQRRIQTMLIHARGDIHTLTGHDQDAQAHSQRADKHLDKLSQDAQASANATELDAIVTKILTHKDQVCKTIETLLAEKAREQRGEPPASLAVHSLRRYDIFPQQRLSNPQEVDAYLARMREKLLHQLEGYDAIELN